MFYGECVCFQEHQLYGHPEGIGHDNLVHTITKNAQNHYSPPLPTVPEYT